MVLEFPRKDFACHTDAREGWATPGSGVEPCWQKPSIAKQTLGLEWDGDNFQANFPDPTLPETNIEAPEVATDVDDPWPIQTETAHGKSFARARSHDTGAQIK